MNSANNKSGISGDEKILLASSLSSTLVLEYKESKWKCVKYASDQILNDEFAKPILKTEFEHARQNVHENILAYECPDGTHEGAFIMERGCTSIEQLVNEKPATLSTTSNIREIVDQMLNALEFMHERDIFQVELTPQTLLIKKDGRRIRLFSPLSVYKNMMDKLLQGVDSEYIAPELLNGTATEFTIQQDIYAAGKMIEYLYGFVKLPRRLKKVISKATSTDPAERYENIDELRQAIRKSKNISTIGQAAIIALGVLATAAFIFYDNTSDIGTQEYVKPAANSHHTFDTIDAEHLDALSGVERMADSVYVDSATIMSRTAETKKAEEIFRKEFLRRATPIINKVYSRTSILGNETEFRSVAAQNMAKLQQIGEQLANQYKLSTASGEKIASDIINELTAERLKTLKEGGN